MNGVCKWSTFADVLTSSDTEDSDWIGGILGSDTVGNEGSEAIDLGCKADDINTFTSKDESLLDFKDTLDSDNVDKRFGLDVDSDGANDTKIEVNWVNVDEDENPVEDEVESNPWDGIVGGDFKDDIKYNDDFISVWFEASEDLILLVKDATG